MFDARTILAEQHEPVSVTSGDARADAIVDICLGRQVQKGRHRIKYPRASADASELVKALSDLPPEKLAISRSLLLDPPRVYGLQAGKEAGTEQELVLVGAYDLDNIAAIAQLRFGQGGKWGGDPIHGAEITWIELDQSGIGRLSLKLEDVYVATDSTERGDAIRKRAGRPQSSVWVGGSPREVDNLPYDWETRIAAVHAVRGLACEVIAQPRTRPDHINIRTIGEPPDVVLVWNPYAHSEPVSKMKIEYETRGMQNRLLIVEERGFRDALEMARLELDQFIETYVAQQPAPPEPGEVRFYQKVGGGASGDRYEMRDGPCQHGKWATLNKADKKRKAITRKEKVSPTRIEGCIESACHRIKVLF